jgi:hypothetical protein
MEDEGGQRRWNEAAWRFVFMKFPLGFYRAVSRRVMPQTRRDAVMQHAAFKVRLFLNFS